jgi:preprotein translocase subunit SecF
MENFFGKNYKKYLIVPAVVAIIMLFLSFGYPGFSQGIDLTGGNLIIVRSQSELFDHEITAVLEAEFDLVELKVSTIASPTGYGAWIEYSKDPIAAQAEELINKAIETIEVDSTSTAHSLEAITLLGGEVSDFDNAKLALLGAQDALSAYNEAFSTKLQTLLTTELGLGEDVEFQKKEISQTLGQESQFAAAQIFIFGMILIVIIIFFSFRQVVPSLAIILAMVFDILAGVTGMALMNIPLSLTTIPALLMLVGYSVDTDIMLTTRLLKDKTGLAKDRAANSMKTGLTMTGTTLAALSAMVIIAYFNQIEVIYHIAAILLFGLVGDVISTWLMNAPMLLWFMERKK